jgi:hypothetical protein
MTDYSPPDTELNAQTVRLRGAVSRGESLATRRGGTLAQIFFCEGCCCGRAEKGFPRFPREMIKESWKQLGLNQAIQLTISGCLGPCDLANVFYLLPSDGAGQWFGGLSENWQYETIIHWAEECRTMGLLRPLPDTLSGHRFTRFGPVSETARTCSLSGRKLDGVS